uniref:Prolyl endopeptidase n=1 Tax=Meloidogyne javanica TaxID=6303 RepID=A0A915LMM6_MELJA
MNDGREIVFLDPNIWSNEGLLAIKQLSWTNDGKFLAYGISENGSDWTKIKKYPYSQSCVGTEIDKLIFQCLYYHKIGEKNDILIYREWSNPDLMIRGTVLYNDRYLFITVIQGFKNKLLYADLNDVKKMDQLKIYPIFDRLDASYEIVAVGGDFLIIFTNFRAPLFKVVKIKFGSNVKPNQNKEWEEIIKEGHNKLERAQFADNKLIIWYLEDMQDQIYIYSLDGILLSRPKFNIGNNGIGIIKEFHVSKDSKIFFGCSSTFTPYLNYEGVIDKKDMNIHPIDSGTIESRYTNDLMITKLLVKGKHYVDIPVQLLHKKDMKLDGNNPVLLYGYGGFNTLESLEFSASRLIFVNNFNGIFVVANIRGGREKGETSHGHGSGYYKKNVFEDFIEVANHLIRLKYTNPKRLAIYGVSNGGLLCCACSVLKPDLFNCVVSVVGLTDMLKYDQYTIGASWIPEYGDLRDANQFNYNYK